MPTHDVHFCSTDAPSRDAEYVSEPKHGGAQHRDLA